MIEFYNVKKKTKVQISEANVQKKKLMNAPLRLVKQLLVMGYLPLTKMEPS